MNQVISKKVLYVLVVLIGASLWNCGKPNEVTGGTSDQGNAIVRGVVRDSSGQALANVKTHLIPIEYNALLKKQEIDSLTQFTDSLGRYEYTEIRKGLYNLEISGDSGEQKVLVSNVSVSSNSEVVVDTVLETAGIVELKIPPYALGKSGYVYIPGSSFSQKVQFEADTLLTLRGIPSGYIASIQYTENVSSERFLILGRSIEVDNRDTVRVQDLQGWEYSGSAVVSLHSAEVNAINALTSFPLLVTIEHANSIFEQSYENGKDLRVLDRYGNVLSYEFEIWDRESETIKAWIRIPQGTAEARMPLMLLWGNSNVNENANLEKVFSEEQGYTAVWHLSDTNYNQALGYRNATNNNLHGTGLNLDANSVDEGLLGDAVRFRKKGESIVILGSRSGPLNLPENGNYTLSAWVKAAEMPTDWHPIFHKGENQYGLQLTPSKKWEFVEAGEHGRELAWSSAVINQWVHVVGVRSGSSHFLYINGKLMATGHKHGTSKSRVEDVDVYIGKSFHQSHRFWNGWVDEMRVYDESISSKEIWLNYHTQKDGGKYGSFLLF